MNGLGFSSPLFSVQVCARAWIPRARFETDLVPIRGRNHGFLFHFGIAGPRLIVSALTSHALPRIILRMARPDAVRRVKSYSAADGFVYQYYFFEGNRAQRDGSAGGEFTYVVSIDRQSAFPFKIFVHQSALDGWAAQNGRSLSSSEEYAVAKMRLFNAFDEGAVKASPQGEPPREVIVNEANLEELLGQLGI